MDSVLQIKLCFLMISHMYEDIDQVYSCISKHLSKNNARTLLELIGEIGLSYSPAVNASLLPFMYDVKQWLEGCIVSSLSGHTHHHQFKLTKGPDGKAWLFYKKWSMCKKCSPEGLRLIESVPRGKPNLVEPDLNKLNLGKIKQDLPKYCLHFDQETQEWWEAFINDGGSTATTQRPTWMLDALWPAKDQPPAQDA